MSFLAIWESVENADWMHLSEDEEVLWTGRPSLHTILVAVVGGVLVAIVGIAATVLLSRAIESRNLPALLGYLPLILTVAGIVWAAIAYLNWVRLLYVITSSEIYVKYGLLSRDVTQIRLSRIQNTTFEQSILQRLLGYGDVRIYTAGSGTAALLFDDVPDPETVTQLLSDVMGSENTNERRQHDPLQ
ncbi:MAG: PH domain-containing protein [Halovenus sp.]